MSTHLPMHFEANARAKGMYERLYQRVARNCPTAERAHKRILLKCRAATKVRMMKSNMTQVAMKRVSLNIFFSWYLKAGLAYLGEVRVHESGVSTLGEGVRAGTWLTYLGLGLEHPGRVAGKGVRVPVR